MLDLWLYISVMFGCLQVFYKGFRRFLLFLFLRFSRQFRWALSAVYGIVGLQNKHRAVSPKGEKMASLFGFKLKNRRTFQGGDWEGNQGDLWYGNKKVAWYNDSGDGSMADIDFYDGRKGREEYQPILDAAVKQYYERFPLEGEYADLPVDAEMFMGELLELMDREKTYKSMLKKGYPAVIMYKKEENSPYEQIVGLQSEQAVKKYIEKNKLTKYKLFTSAEDFDIK